MHTLIRAVTWRSLFQLTRKGEDALAMRAEAAASQEPPQHRAAALPSMRPARAAQLSPCQSHSLAAGGVPVRRDVEDTESTYDGEWKWEVHGTPHTQVVTLICVVAVSGLQPP